MYGDDNRRARILTELIGTSEPDLATRRLCEVCADVTGVTGAGIMLMSGDDARGSLCTSNSVSALIERLQFDLGEGPCVDAYSLDRPVLEPDLARPETPRWLGFAGPALRGGVGAVFGFPMRVGTVRLGALNLYTTDPGPLSDDQYSNAVVMADVAAQAVLLLQANASPGQLATELEASANFQYVVHQASGMVAAQLDVSVGQALVRLRAHAFSNNRSLTEVARAVVSRMLHLDSRSGDVDRPTGEVGPEQEGQSNR